MKLFSLKSGAADTLPLSGKPDQLFQGDAFPKPFAFNAAVAEVFDDMAYRSIPLYAEVQLAACRWAKDFYQPGSKIYDIGCSTGTTLVLMQKMFVQSAHFIGVDSSPAMVQKAKQKIASQPSEHVVEILCADAMSIEIKDASVIILNYLVQFMPVQKRLDFLKKVCAGLRPGGLLFMSEKLRFANPSFQDCCTREYELFKRQHGYSRSEIERKKESLDQVLVCLTYEEHMELLQMAGFKSSELIIRWQPFATFVAQKSQRR